MYEIKLIAGHTTPEFLDALNRWFETNKAMKIIDIHYLDDNNAYIIFEDLDDGNFD